MDAAVQNVFQMHFAEWNMLGIEYNRFEIFALGFNWR